MKNTKRWLMLFIAATSLASCSLSFGMDILDAIRKYNIGRVAELVTQEGFDFNQTDQYGSTPLSLACWRNNLDMIRLLLDNGAKESVNIANNNGYTPLHWVCNNNNNLEMVRLLLDNGADANKADNKGKTPLDVACFHNNLEIVRLLLENDADINKADNKGKTPLYVACFYNNPNIVRLLLENDADINKADNEGKTPLYVACFYSNSNIVRLLLENDADINKADNKGKTPLYRACYNDNPNIVRLLLENGANIDPGSLTKIQDDLQDQATQVEAQQIQATFNLTQRFDKWIKTGEFFDLTDQEKQDDRLLIFRNILLNSKRKEIIRNREPKKSITKTLKEDKYRRLDDCTLICEQ